MTTEVRKKRKNNKSAAIRDYLAANPQAGPTEVVKALAEQKVKVTSTHVSNVKSRLAAGHAVGTRSVGRPRKNAVVVTAAAGTPVTIELLVEAKKMVDRCGSMENAQRALSSLAKLF